GSAEAEAGATRSARGAVECGMSELIVGAPLVLVRQNLVGLRDLLEPRLGLGIAGIAVRMVLQRLLAIGLLDLFLRGVARHAKQLVEVLTQHESPPVSSLSPGPGVEEARSPGL